MSARACVPAGLPERSCALPPPDCRVYPGFARLAIAVDAAMCPRCHDCCGFPACRALETRLARGPVSDWDGGVFAVRAEEFVAGLAEPGAGRAARRPERPDPDPYASCTVNNADRPSRRVRFPKIAAPATDRDEDFDEIPDVVETAWVSPEGRKSTSRASSRQSTASASPAKGAPHSAATPGVVPMANPRPGARSTWSAAAHWTRTSGVSPGLLRVGERAGGH